MGLCIYLTSDTFSMGPVIQSLDFDVQVSLDLEGLVHFPFLNTFSKV